MPYTKGGCITSPSSYQIGLVKQFTKALSKEGNCFKYLTEKFPRISSEKLKEGIFVGPQIRKLMKDNDFEKIMTAIEKNAWISFKEVVKKFLGNNKDPEYRQIVMKILTNFKNLDSNMSIKIHFLHSHIDFFRENLFVVNEEHGERFHQDIKDMEKRYQGRWNRNMMANYCYMLKRDCKSAGSARKSKNKVSIHLQRKNLNFEQKIAAYIHFEHFLDFLKTFLN